jgi:multidrug transporter EmrE-like cation transporter
MANLSSALVLVGIAIMLGATGQTLQKKGLNELGRLELAKFLDISYLLHVFTNLYVFLGVLCYVISLFLWLTALSGLELSFMYPLLSISYVIVAVFAWIFIGETITLMRWAGIALVLLGSWLILGT